jgi:nucleotide-sensitive chloride channel 1A
VHAQVGASVLLELNLSDSNVTADEDIEHLQIRLTPNTTSNKIISPPALSSILSTKDAEKRTADPSFALYMAIGDCQELNPDPAEDDDSEEGEGGFGGQGFDETAPGATGWITSENLHEYTDADGNFKMPEGVTVFGDEGEEDGDDVQMLGEGAGRVRRADEVDAEDGADGEAKWQRTGK